jgi:hypothetical protein
VDTKFAGCERRYKKLNLQTLGTLHVRFGSLADMCAAKSHVCFTLESRHVRRN